MSNTTPVIPPDLAQARKFLDALDPRPGALFGFRTFDDRGDDPRLAVKAFGALDSGIRQSSDQTRNGKPCRPAGLLTWMQGKGASAFVVPNQLDGQGQRKSNVIAVRALYVDCDSRLEVERVHAFIAAFGLMPTIIVASGGVHEGTDKLQIYWHVDGCPVEKFTRAQLTLVSRIGSDPAVQDAGRVMRLPGFYHHKRGPRMSRIVSQSSASYDYPAFMARVLGQTQICDPWAGSKGTGARRAGTMQPVNAAGPSARLRVLLDLHGGLVTPAVKALLREALALTETEAGNRHATLLAVAARLVQVGWPDGDIQALVQPVVVEHWGGDRSARLAGMLAWTREQETATLVAEPVLSPHATRLVAAFSAARRAAG